MKSSRSKLCTYLLIISCLTIWLAPKISYSANIFDPSSSDLSIEYLKNIFGTKLKILNFGDPAETNDLFFSNLFQIFNSVILVVAIFVVSYVSLISTINTAQEGQVMGKKWSSVWIPLRSTIGLLLLSPLPGSGYSTLQIGLMWVILNGVGCADRVWNFVLDNLAQGVSITQKTEINKQALTTISTDANELAKNLFNSLACMEILNLNLRKNNSTRTLDYLINSNNPEPDLLEETIDFVAPSEEENPLMGNILNNFSTISLCGKFKIRTFLQEDELKEQNGDHPPLVLNQRAELVQKVHAIKVSALKTLLEKIHIIVKAIITASDSKPNKDIVLPKEINAPGLLYREITNYQNKLASLTKQAAIQWIDRNSHLEQTPISEFIIQQGKDFGWITAGSYYYLLSQKALKSLLQTATEPVIAEDLLFNIFTGNQIKKDKLREANLGILNTEISPYVLALTEQSQYINNLFLSPKKQLIITNQLKQEAKKINKNLMAGVEDDIEENVMPHIEQLLSKLEAGKNSQNLQLRTYFNSFLNLHKIILKEIQHCFNIHNDPLISQAIFGVTLMQTAESTWINLAIGSLFSEHFKDLLSNATEATFLSFAIGTFPIILLILGICWTIGASFAIYAPMVPYMMFTLTALSWFALVIEAIVAAPIVAIGLVAPAQDELGKVAPALGIITNIFLKPILMLIGLIMGAKLYSTVVQLINFGFHFSFASLQAQSGSSIFSWMVMLILYTGFIITLINKCYALIYILPDKILRWIGITGEQTDISSIKETQQSFEQGVKQGVGPIEGMAAAGAKKLKENMESTKLAQAAARDTQAVRNPRDATGLE